MPSSLEFSNRPEIKACLSSLLTKPEFPLRLKAAMLPFPGKLQSIENEIHQVTLYAPIPYSGQIMNCQSKDIWGVLVEKIY